MKDDFSRNSISPEQWQKMDPIIDQALEVSSTDQEDVVRQLCGDDSELIQDILNFLGASRKTTGFLDDSAGEKAVNLVDRSTEQWDPSKRLAERMGPYRLLEVLGEGGMGVVYKAERADGQFKKTVAIKLMLSLCKGSSLRDRFLNERQLLARLEHPNIARLLDGGISEDGFPYIVMELVDGLSLVYYARKNGLTLDQRLDLFLSVCAAVDSAHQKFVLHCDLKPSNILVTETGQVRLLDFGISCCLEKAGKSFKNDSPGALLTPDFASPEQQQGIPLTTATDIYSLGVLLYDLVAGRRPFEMENGEVPAILRRPSVAGSDMPWAGRLRRDLDNIVLTMLKEDPRDRYTSVQEVIDDLRRFKEHLPVRVTPSTPMYLVRKIVSRNKALSFVILVAWLGLVGAVFSTTRSAGIAKRERDVARQESLKSGAVSKFLVELFENSDPNENPAEQVTARQLLDQGTERIRDNLADQPEVQSDLMYTMATVYSNLGLYNQAAELNDDVLNILSGMDDVESSDKVAALSLRGQVYILQGDFPAAVESAKAAISLDRATNSGGGGNLAGALHVLAHALKEEGKLEESEAAYREAIEEWRRPAHPDTIELASSLVSFGEMLRVAGQPLEAEPIEREALALSRAVAGDLHPLVLDCTNNLALVMRNLQRHEEALELSLEAVEMTRSLFGDESIRMAVALNNLGALYKKQRKLDEAEEVHREALRIRRQILEPGHPSLASSLNNLAITMEAKGELTEAAQLLDQALVIVRETRGDRHRHVGVTLYNLGKVYIKNKEFAASIPMLEEAHGIMVETLPEGSWLVGNAQSRWGYSLALTGEVEKGYELVLEGYNVVLAARDKKDPRTQQALKKLFEVCEMLGKQDEAAQYRATWEENK